MGWLSKHRLNNGFLELVEALQVKGETFVELCDGEIHHINLDHEDDVGSNVEYIRRITHFQRHYDVRDLIACLKMFRHEATKEMPDPGISLTSRERSIGGNI